MRTPTCLLLLRHNKTNIVRQLRHHLNIFYGNKGCILWTFVIYIIIRLFAYITNYNQAAHHRRYQTRPRPRLHQLRFPRQLPFQLYFQLHC